MKFNELYKNACAEINPTPEFILSVKDMAEEEMSKRRSYSFPGKFIPVVASALIITGAIFAIPHLSPLGKFNEITTDKRDIVPEISVINKDDISDETVAYDNDIKETEGTNSQRNSIVEFSVQEEPPPHETVFFSEKADKQFETSTEDKVQKIIAEGGNADIGIGEAENNNNKSLLEYGDYSQWSDESLWKSFSSDIWLFESPDNTSSEQEELPPVESETEEKTEAFKIEPKSRFKEIEDDDIEEIKEEDKLKEKHQESSDDENADYKSLGEFLSESINSNIIIKEVSYSYNEFIVIADPELLDTKVILSMLVANKSAPITDISPVKDFYVKIKLDFNDEDIILFAYANDVITVGAEGGTSFKLNDGDSNRLLLLVKES